MALNYKKEYFGAFSEATAGAAQLTRPALVDKLLLSIPHIPAKLLFEEQGREKRSPGVIAAAPCWRLPQFEDLRVRLSRLSIFNPYYQVILQLISRGK